MAYKSGDYYVICDRCGLRKYASECRMTWDKLFVCADTCWEPKHPQYTPPKPLGEKQNVSAHRPEHNEAFVTAMEVTGTDGLNYACIENHTATADNKPVTGVDHATYWVQQGSSGLVWVSGSFYSKGVGDITGADL